MSKKIEWETDKFGELCFKGSWGDLWTLDGYNLFVSSDKREYGLSHDEILQIAEKIKELRNED